MMSCRNKRKAYRRKDVRARGSIFYVPTVVGVVVNCIDDIYGGGTHTVPAVTFWETHRAKMRL